MITVIKISKNFICKYKNQREPVLKLIKIQNGITVLFILRNRGTEQYSEKLTLEITGISLGVSVSKYCSVPLLFKIELKVK